MLFIVIPIGKKSFSHLIKKCIFAPAYLIGLFYKFNKAKNINLCMQL